MTAEIVSCSVAGCENPARTKGMCSKHYSRLLRHGGPKGGARRYSNPEDAFSARTEWSGGCLIWTGSKSSAHYGYIWVGRRYVPVHRYAWERVNGPIPKGMLIDHRFHCVPSCVNVDHLRLATRSQNNSNRNGASSLSSSGVRNVQKHGKGWMVRVKGIYFGTFPTISEAASVAEEKRSDLFGEFKGTGVAGHKAFTITDCAHHKGVV